MTAELRERTVPWVLVWGLVFLGGCAAVDKESGAGADQSFDGLTKVVSTRNQEAWVLPGLDLSGYTAILPTYAGSQYVPTKTPAAARAPVARPPFPVSKENRDRLDALVREVFGTELSRLERFTLTDVPGPSVLILEGGLIGIASAVPPEAIGRNEVYLASVGSATLVIELRDSESNAVFVRLFDRRSAGTPTAAMPSNPVTNAAEVRRLLRSWAQLLRKRLDEVPTLTEADD